MAGFIRRFLFDPGNEVITAIEGVVIIDREPPSSITGLFNGTVTLVAEWDDGVFDVPVQVGSATDLSANFGGFGFLYDGVNYNNPCARSRLADGALVPEYWNGNGAVAVANKKFGRLIAVRADTSVGSVQFTRQASSLGNANFEWDLEPGQVLAVDIGAGNVSATFNAAKATVTSANGVYNTTFVGGETMRIAIDEGTPNAIVTDVYFLASDQSHVAVVARLNAAVGYTAFAVASLTTTFTGRVRGSSGNVRIVSQDAAVATALGFSVGITAGTGNVANIDKVSFAEAKTIVEAAVAGTALERTATGNIRVSAVSAASIEVDSATTATAFGFDNAVHTAAAGVDGIIPAGTRVRTSGGLEWVTCQTVEVAAASVGPYSVKVRPANDDGTGLAAIAGAVTVVPFPIQLSGFAVVNPLPLSAALTEAQIDAAYVRAIDATLNQNSVARETNVIVSARQSNAVRSRLKQNAIDASSVLRGRMAVVRPPLKTTRAAAKSSLTQPGVGATRDQRVVYAYPGATTFMPQIAARGTAGGAGFTATGYIDTGADVWMASLMSQLPPEENPGQDTPFLAGIIAIEQGNADVQSLSQTDYELFKAAGIAALQNDDGNFIIASGVTSVNPTVSPSLVRISRRRMADFIQDSLARRLRAFVKKLSTRARRGDVVGEIDGFLIGLVSPGNAASQRIEDYRLDGKSGNTAASLAAGIFRIIVKVKTLSSLDYIVLDTTVGENVSVVEIELPLAA